MFHSLVAVFAGGAAAAAAAIRSLLLRCSFQLLLSDGFESPFQLVFLFQNRGLLLLLLVLLLVSAAAAAAASAAIAAAICSLLL